MKFNKSSGQVSRLLLVLAIVVLVAVIITFLILKMAEKPPAPAPKTATTIPLPVYEQTLGHIRFVFEGAIDEGTVLKVSDAVQHHGSGQKDFSAAAGAKFIKVTVGAQNTGTGNTISNAWAMGNIVDSEGRNFIPEQSAANLWLPNPDNCGQVLEPQFDPTPCTKIYEVSKQSSGLKVTVLTGKNNGPVNNQASSYLLDLIVK